MATPSADLLVNKLPVDEADLENREGDNDRLLICAVTPDYEPLSQGSEGLVPIEANRR